MHKKQIELMIFLRGDQSDIDLFSFSFQNELKNETKQKR